MIQRIMNQIKMYEKLAKTFHDTIQKSLNQINWLEKRYDQEKPSFLYTNNTQVKKGS
jgi:hypothetical protein